MKTLKQEYLLSDSLDDRRIISIRAANAAWARKRRTGRFPTKEFLDEFLEPFIQYEKHRLQADKLHHITQKISKEEELVHAEAMVYWSKKCIEKLEG